MLEKIIYLVTIIISFMYFIIGNFTNSVVCLFILLVEFMIFLLIEEIKCNKQKQS